MGIIQISDRKLVQGSIAFFAVAKCLLRLYLNGTLSTTSSTA